MAENCNHDCSSCTSNCGEKKTSFLKAPHPESRIRKVIGVISGKGGVGKSSVTCLLARALAESGVHTAIMDADITGPSIPKAFGIHEKARSSEGVIYPAFTQNGTQIMSINLLLDNETDPVVWRGPIIAGVVKQFWTDVIWTDVDVMLIDMPPGTGDVPLTVYQSIPVDGLIVVTSPQQLVSMIVKKAMEMSKMMNVPIIGLIENYSYFRCPDCGGKHQIYGEGNLHGLAKEYGIDNILELPIDPNFAKAFDAGMVEDAELSVLQDMKGNFLNNIIQTLQITAHD